MQNHSQSEETVQQRHLPLVARFLHGTLKLNLRFCMKRIACSLVLLYYVGMKNEKQQKPHYKQRLSRKGT